MTRRNHLFRQIGKPVLLCVLFSSCWLWPAGAQQAVQNAVSDSRQVYIATDSATRRHYNDQLEEMAGVEQRERKYVSMRYEEEMRALLLSRDRLMWWLWLFAGLIFLLLGLLTRIFYRNGRKLFAKQQQLKRLEHDAVWQEQRIAQLSTILEGEERERSHLARDLHDGLGGLLSGIKLQLSEIASFVKDNRQLLLVQHTLYHMDNAMDELRGIARNMMPALLLEYGLQEAVLEYCRTLKHPDVRVTCQVFNYTAGLSTTRQMVLYRIVQELVSNALKYANASTILVQLQQSGDRLYLTVEDNGNGFALSAVPAGSGTGLSGIQARVAFLNGVMELQSLPGTGTTISIECGID